jgi:uncharacterized protein YecA (UPF0149 family)
MLNETPPRFEDEFPEEAETLMKLCQNKELRERMQWSDSSTPRSERLYPHLNDMKLSILGWKYGQFSKGKTYKGYKRETPKVGRNDPCQCGSGKKYKKCCMNA